VANVEVVLEAGTGEPGGTFGDRQRRRDAQLMDERMDDTARGEHARRDRGRSALCLCSRQRDRVIEVAAVEQEVRPACDRIGTVLRALSQIGCFARSSSAWTR
jgi:hypothetical protein